MEKIIHHDKLEEEFITELEATPLKERKRSKSVDSRKSSVSSEKDNESHKGARRRSKESTISEERSTNQRLSKALEEEDAFLEYIKSLPAMASDKVEAYKKSQSLCYKRSPSEAGGGLEHLDNLYRLMEQLGQLRIQNSKLQERVKYLENISHDEIPVSKIELETDNEDSKSHSRNKRSTKCKSSHYGLRQTFMKCNRERSRSVGVEEIIKSTTQYRLAGAHVIDSRGSGSNKAKVSKWTKVKEAFRWEKASNGVLPEAKSQDSGLSAGEEVRYLKVPNIASDHSSSISISPADSVLSGQSLSQTIGSKELLVMPHVSSSASNSDEDLEDPNFSANAGCSARREREDQRRSKSLEEHSHLLPSDLMESNEEKKVLYDNQTTECDDNDILGKEYDKCLKRKLGPMLTITLPSTEELHSGIDHESTTKTKISTKPPPSPQADEKHTKGTGKPRSHEDSSSFRDISHLPTFRKVSGGSAGTSPPTPRRLSKWSKVKNAFLTSGSTSEDYLHKSSCSVPSSPVKTATFAYDLESDELSSGEFMDDNIRDDDVFPELPDDMCDLTKNENIHAEIQRNYEELQFKLSEEFHKKLCEWERIKSAGTPGTPPCTSRVTGSGFSSGTSSIAEETPQDKNFRKKMEEWEKMKCPTSSIAKHRESVTFQQLGEENLSPDFRKKLEEWEKIKSSPAPPTPDILNNSQPQFKKKITDWQLWRPGVMTSKSDVGIAGTSNQPIDLPEDFYKKLQEWERLKQGASYMHPDTDSPGNKTPSPGSSRRDCSEHKSGKTHHSPTNKKEKGINDFGFQIKIQKSKSHHEVKELAWLEKELHKIEREKLRLERERDKYLEREARLEKLRKAIGANLKKQEILIPTSTGLFRFEGISQKFTRKLYEWEKAKGIRPEASTFALLDPGYQPPGSSTMTADVLGSNGSLLTRSKSVGSVVDIVALSGNTNTLTHQPSSLSLNHMEQLEGKSLSCTLAGSDDICGQASHRLYGAEPEAMIVDIEDVIEETASPLEHTPAIESHTPVYCYAPVEITCLIDSSASGSDKNISRLGVQAQSSIELLQENITLLDKLQKKEDICRELESKIEDVEVKLNNTERIHKEHLGTLVKEDCYFDKASENEEDLDEIKEKLIELESQQERLLEEGVTLQHCYVQQSEQQAMIAQDLVGKVKQLKCNIATSTPKGECMEMPKKDEGQNEIIVKVQELTTQLLNLAEKLELAVGERTNEISALRRAVSTNNRAPALHKLRANPHWFSTDSVSSIGVIDSFQNQGSEDLSRLPVLLTNKIHELKSCLGCLDPESDMKKDSLISTKEITVTYPDSPEVEATYVFNISKNKRKESTVSEINSDELPIKNENDNLNPASDFFTNKNYSIVPTTVLELHNDLDGNKTASKKNGNPNQTAIESFVEFTYPIKTYFKENLKEHRSPGKFGNISSDSDNSDCDNIIRKKNKFKEGIISDALESGQKKSKRNRNNSGILERRRSRTEIKDKNSDEEVNDAALFNEHCSTRKPLNNRSKKSSKSNILLCESNLNEGEKKDSNEASNVCIDSKTENIVENSVVTLKSLNSPKCVSRRNKKGIKSTKDELCGETQCLPYNYCCHSQIEETIPNPQMTVNVFVPTTRKIFSPVRKDSKGETSTVVSYIVEEPAVGCCSSNTMSNETEVYGDIKKNDKIDSSTQSHSSNQVLCKPNFQKNITQDKKAETTQTYDFIMPPCWIIKQARAQSASPALQRRSIQKSWSKEKIDKEILEKTTESPKVKSEADSQKSDNSKNNSNKDIKSVLKEPVPISLSEQSNIVPDHHAQRDLTAKEGCRKNSSSSESVENRPLRKEGSSIPPSLKLRSEAGFPPISPLTVRREMKVLKETAPSIRMMIAKYNQKVHESQELTGTKSPESGGQSPIAWRSPVSERRIKAQMEKYQDEVRKALQGNAGSDFYSNARIGQVQKSASAGYIRPFDKGCSNESINERSANKCLKQTFQYHGILKSSSAEAIKSFSPIQPRRNEVKTSLINLETGTSSLLTMNHRLSPENCIIKTQEHIHQTTDNMNVDCKTETSTRLGNNITLTTLLNKNNINLIEGVQGSEATGIRALKIKKAKEEFLSRGCVTNKLPPDNKNFPNTPDTPTQNERLSWTDSKSRLSQISCGSESSYENVPMIVVSGKEPPRDQDGTLLVKSASAGMINDSSTCGRVFEEDSSNTGKNNQEVIPKSKSSILSRFRKSRLKRNKEKETSKLDAVSTLCRQSLVVDINKRNTSTEDNVPSTSKSCPSSPVLHKKYHTSSASWIPKLIFKPK